jgi:hypothetical protein
VTKNETCNKRKTSVYKKNVCSFEKRASKYKEEDEIMQKKIKKVNMGDVTVKNNTEVKQMAKKKKGKKKKR